MNETDDDARARILGLRAPDTSWASGVTLVADQVRLDKKYSTVTLVHTGTQPNKHVIVDRHLRPVDLQPGQRKPGVEMLNEDIEELRRYRAPGRFFADGKLKPDHPILIEDVTPYEPPTPQRIEAEKRAEAARR